MNVTDDEDGGYPEHEKVTVVFLVSSAFIPTVLIFSASKYRITLLSVQLTTAVLSVVSKCTEWIKFLQRCLAWVSPNLSLKL